VVDVHNCAIPVSPKLRIGKLPSITLTGFCTAAAALLTLATIASHGFSENGVRLGSQVAWRFAFVLFVVALVSGPLCRTVPFGLCRFLAPHGRQMIWSFCAAIGVYLASVFVPVALAQPLPHHEALDPGMLLFVVFCGGLAAVMAYAAGPEARTRLGEKAQRTILAAGASYFWLTYSLSGLAHISGPHRPDLFSNISLSLMILALLLRFLDRFLVKWKGAASP